jgi:hypothetical protein
MRKKVLFKSTNAKEKEGNENRMKYIKKRKRENERVVGEGTSSEINEWIASWGIKGKQNI